MASIVSYLSLPSIDFATCTSSSVSPKNFSSCLGFSTNMSVKVVSIFPSARVSILASFLPDFENNFLRIPLM